MTRKGGPKCKAAARSSRSSEPSRMRSDPRLAYTCLDYTCVNKAIRSLFAHPNVPSGPERGYYHLCCVQSAEVNMPNSRSYVVNV